jgi:hypothetical protein
MRMPEKNLPPLLNKGVIPAATPVAGSNIYSLVDFSGRWKRSPGFLTQGEDTGFRIGGMTS